MQPNLIKIFFFLIFLVAGQNLMGQSYLPYSAGQNDKNDKPDLYRNCEITVGYLPKTGGERLKTSISLNNVLFQRIGAYSSFEYAFKDDKFFNITGGTVSLHRIVYLWGGMDLFSKNGLIRSGYESTRKEVGVGITPYKFLVARIGWSGSIGFSLAIGIRFQL